MVMGRWIECRGDLLAEGAKSLQLRLRDRFRVVTVTYHRRRNLRIAGGGGYFSSSVQRWLDRFSEFRRDSLPSSSTFYRKRGGGLGCFITLFRRHIMKDDEFSDLDCIFGNSELSWLPNRLRLWKSEAIAEPLGTPANILQQILVLSSWSRNIFPPELALNLGLKNVPMCRKAKKSGLIKSISSLFRSLIVQFYISVSKDIDAEDDSVLTRMLQAVAVPVIGNVCHVFMHGLNRIQIFGAEKLQHAVLNRPEKKAKVPEGTNSLGPLVSNHVAAMDDPLVIASLLPPGMLLDANGLRWTLCASDRCFKNPVTSAFFKYAKVLPVSRGDGIYQKGMDLAISKLNVEGGFTYFQRGVALGMVERRWDLPKEGLGDTLLDYKSPTSFSHPEEDDVKRRLVLDADNIPMVVPFVHTGMQDVMPVGAKFPRIGKTVTILVGDPISFDDLINEGANISRGKLYDAVSARIGDRLQKLKLQVEGLAVEQALQSQTYPSHVTERAAGLLQNVDWESIGMENYIGIDDNSPRQEPVLEPNVAQLYPQESSRDERCSRAGASGEGGFVSRIRGYMDSTEFMVFAARGLFTNHRTNEYFVNLHGVSPLKAWNKFWKSVSGDHHFPANSVFTEAMQC
ncbi:Tafazzin [Sesamum angolense]|uniref:Tafazzin n=1 Tax=Sesamum angolense TaxID=2727404 RepID=A0AAE2C2I3_9LAMI|nr:Tafazzin [Sesamum angolense]